ncbi:MAG: hypothetical protein ABIQ93_00350 [Saprospiraceae bacterium]
MANDTIQLSHSLSKLNDAALRMARRAVDDNLQFANELRGFFSGLGLKMPGINLGQKHHSNCQCGCCPPSGNCPPHCLLELNRSAFPGETVIVPFTVRNTTGSPRSYKVGVRDLLDQQGNKALHQPVLSQALINLAPNQAITLSIMLPTTDMAVGSYQTEIVLREKDLNQNICFTLQVVPLPAAPEAHPRDEKQYMTQFQGWQSHFYCTPPTKQGSLTISHETNLPGNK